MAKSIVTKTRQKPSASSKGKPTNRKTIPALDRLLWKDFHFIESQSPKQAHLICKLVHDLAKIYVKDGAR